MKEKVPIQPIQSVSSVFHLEIGVKAMPSTRPATSCCRQTVSHSIARFDCPAAKTLHIIINWWQYVGYCSVLFNPIVVPWFVGSTWRLVFCLFNLERTMEGRKEGRTKTRLRAIGSLGDGSSFTILVVLFVPEVPFVALIYSSLLSSCSCSSAVLWSSSYLCLPAYCLDSRRHCLQDLD